MSCAFAQVVVCLVGFFLLAWLLSIGIDERKSREIAKLHRAHMLMFGEVRSGLGMHTVHLSPTDPRRIAVINMFQSLKVRGRVICCFFATACAHAACIHGVIATLESLPIQSCHHARHSLFNPAMVS